MQKIILILLIFYGITFSKHSGFIDNTGLWDSRVLYVSFDVNETIWITKNGFIVQNSNKNIINESFLKNNYKVQIDDYVIEYHFLDCKFNDVKHIGFEDSKFNFIKTNDESKWLTNCNPTSELMFNYVKDNSKVRYYFENGRFRYDIIEDNNIEIAINGADKLESLNNELVISSGEKVIYQKDLKGIYENEIIDVSLNINDNIISFSSPADYFSGLIIDPLIYGTYLGGLGYDSGEDVKIDNDGNILIAGETTSLNFPATVGSFSRLLNSNDTILRPDVFVTKLDQNNNHIFTTYIGSSVSDYGRGVSYDSLNHIYITGYSQFTQDFPIVGDTYNQTHNGAFDGFVIKLKQTGDEILLSSFIGSIRDDFPLSIETFENGRCVITGYTTESPDSARFPVTSGVFNGVYHGNIDGFVTIFNNNFETLVWSGIIGGLKDDFPQEVKVDSEENIYICGLTRSPNYPTSPNTIKRTYTDNENSKTNSDGFVSKISADGQYVLFSTLIGGNDADIAYSLAVDSRKNVYVGGSTGSEDFHLSDNAFSKVLNRGKNGSNVVDAFVMKIDSLAENIIYSSYLGGESNDRCYGVDIDRFGALYGTGLTNSVDLPTSFLTYDDEFNDSLVFSDMMMFKVSPNGDSLSYSSYFGGERSDLGKAIKVKYENTVVITGNTSSTFIPTTEDGVQYQYQDSLKSDAFAIEMFFEDFTNSDYIICRGYSIEIDSDISSTTTQLQFRWSPAESLDNPTKEFPIASPQRTTQYQCVVTDEQNEKYVALILVSVIPGITSEINGEQFCDNGVEYIYSTPNNPGSTFKWLAINGNIISDDTLSSVKVIWNDAANGVLRIIENSQYGCGDTVWREIDYRSSYQLDIVPFGNYILCEGDTVVFDGGAQYSDYQWNSGSRTRYDTVYSAGVHFFTATDENGDPFSSSQATVTTKPKPNVPNIIYYSASNEFLCLSAGSGYQWYYYNEKIEGARNRRFIPTRDGCYRVEITSSNGCTNFSEVSCVTVSSSVDKDRIFSVYPNPFNDLITVISEHLINRIEIYDLLGNQVLNIEPYNFEENIDLSKLSNGVYVIKINNEFHKIIKY